ncbi:GFA family protein [Rhodosalinus sp. K401]|uniref:GFA family protein n=1 Tax=Rhodosalinus sp. K401 TaxID=3239195 RepID=UPI003524DAE3
MGDLSGRCFCGAVRWRSDGAILWAAICHCIDCRRAASADHVSWLGVNRSSLSWEGPRQEFQSSERVFRSFCGNCGSPMSFETAVFPEETHLYANALDDPSFYKPAAHIFWSERVPWFAKCDDLPRHEKGFQDAARSGHTLMPPLS